MAVHKEHWNVHHQPHRSLMEISMNIFRILNPGMSNLCTIQLKHVIIWQCTGIESLPHSPLSLCWQLLLDNNVEENWVWGYESSFWGNFFKRFDIFTWLTRKGYSSHIRAKTMLIIREYPGSIYAGLKIRIYQHHVLNISTRMNSWLSVDVHQ
jgi:hypothetical protein